MILDIIVDVLTSTDTLRCLVSIDGSSDMIDRRDQNNNLSILQSLSWSLSVL